MIYLYGDSHARFSFHNLGLENLNSSETSCTMHRVGRDQIIPHFHRPEEGDVLIFAFGEVDCRCHIMRQILLGRKEDEVISELVKNYLECIRKNTLGTSYKAIVVCGVIPPTEQNDYETINGPIRHEFPFVGNDAERVRFTEEVNRQLESGCKVHSFHYFYPYENYKRENGCLKYELSDRCVHIGDNRIVLQELKTLLSSLSN